ncbi:SIMPL domain-containing protein [Patescibacteria group bacterium]|nr:SIMPL domain-containing protein [Patescibacteria group bacterium]
MDYPHTGKCRSLCIPLVVSLILGGAFIYGKKVETRSIDQFTISVNGEGKVNAIPDIAQMNFGVDTGRQKTAEAAMEMLGIKMTKVIDALKAQGIEEKDIATQYLNLNPAYDWKEGERIDRGFEASQNLRVKIRELDAISKVLSAAAAAGANQAGSVSFTIDDPEVLKAQARVKAIANAQEKAVKLANELGASLGKLKGFSEGGGYAPPMARMNMAVMEAGMGGGGDMAPPVPAGEQEVMVNVVLMYELK